MRTRLLIVLLSQLIFSCISSQTPDREFIEKEIRRTMRRQHLPAMAVTVVRGQDILYQEARGWIDMENQIPASTRSVFKLWSVSKAFTAMEIFREIEEGLVDLDAPLSDYLPEFRIKSTYGQQDTIFLRDILAHRAGLPRNEGLLPAGLERDLNFLECFECGAANCYSAYPVGTRYKYSNLGYDLLGRVIEESRKRGFFEQMKLHVLNDLGMQNADFYLGSIDSSLHRALGYEYYKRTYHPLVQYDVNTFPSGNLCGTLEDLSAFLQAVFREDLFARESTLSAMLVDHYSTPADPETMGLGWKLVPMDNGETLAWHDGGAAEGIGSLVAFLPESRIGVAVIGNGTSFSGFYSMQFALKILNRFLDEELQDGRERKMEMDQEKKPPAYEPSPEELERLAGSYAAFGSTAEVRRKGKKLRARLGNLSMILVPQSRSEFSVTHWMVKTGLTRIIKPPVDFTKLKIRFMDTDAGGGLIMIINMGDISHEICPRYPAETLNTGQWKKLCGSYRLADRIPGGSWETRGEDRAGIRLEDGVLIMSGVYGPILPVNDTLLRVLSGPYHGEFLDYDPGTGVILHQKWAFVPAGS